MSVVIKLLQSPIVRKVALALLVVVLEHLGQRKPSK